MGTGGIIDLALTGYNAGLCHDRGIFWRPIGVVGGLFKRRIGQTSYFLAPIGTLIHVFYNRSDGVSYWGQGVATLRTRAFR